jgi:hypothetical protein
MGASTAMWRFFIAQIEYNKDDGHSAGGMAKILPDMVL